MGSVCRSAHPLPRVFRLSKHLFMKQKYTSFFKVKLALSVGI